MKVGIARSITEIDKNLWDEIAADNLMSRYNWLKTFEETYIEKVIPQIFFITDAKGIVGASICYIFYQGNVFGNLDHVIFGRLQRFAKKLTFSFLPALICANSFSYGSHFLLRKDLDPKKRIDATHRLFDAIENTAKSNCLPVAFINATVEEKQLDELLKNNGYQKVLDMPLCYLDVCWNSFKEYGAYLKSVSKNIWTSVKREINKNKKEGVLIRHLEAVDGCEDRLHELVNMNINTHNALPYLFSRDFYRKLKENFGKDAAIYVAFKHGLISAVSISISHGSVSALIVVGVDHELSGKDCTYFNITYYRPIMDALSSGITRINYGRGMYELKRRRGCKVKNIFFYYKPYTLKQNMMAKFLLPLRGWWIKKMLPKNIKASLLKEIGGSV